MRAFDGKILQNLRAQLAPLFEATEQVACQNLDFEVGHSAIREFEDVLCSFSDMNRKSPVVFKKAMERGAITAGTRSPRLLTI